MATTAAARSGPSFDSAAAKREGWTTEPPYVDRAEGFFFSANTIAELASKIAMKFQRVPMPPAALEATVARYNSFVGTQASTLISGRPLQLIKSWSHRTMPAMGDPALRTTRAREATHQRQMPGHRSRGSGSSADFYCGGESAGGFSQHGLARALVQGLIAGRNAMGEPPAGPGHCQVNRV